MLDELKLCVRGSQIKTLQNAFESIKDFILQTVNLEFRESGMELLALDNAQVAMAYLFLSAEGFWSYECKTPRSIGIRVNDMRQALKACGGAEEVHIVMPSDAPQLRFTSVTSNSMPQVTYVLDSLETDSQKFEIPRASWRRTIQMPAKDLKRIVNICNAISQNLLIEWKNGALSFSANEDNKHCKFNINPEEKKPEDPQHIPEPPKVQPFGGPVNNSKVKPAAAGPAVAGPLTEQTPDLTVPEIPNLPELFPKVEKVKEEEIQPSTSSSKTIDPSATVSPQEEELQNVRALFPMNYMCWCTKTEPSNGIVRLLLKPNFPLCLTYDIVDWGELTFVLSAVDEEIPPETEDGEEFHAQQSINDFEFD